MDLEAENAEFYGRPKNLQRIKLGQTLVPSQFYILLDLKVQPQYQEEDEGSVDSASTASPVVGVYSVNGLFGTEN